jgi:hypothetical protein
VSIDVSCPSVTMIVWASAWLHGAAAADDVLDALLAWADLHEVAAADDGTATALDLPATGEPAVSPALLLAAARRSGVTGGRLVLPVSGDVRGLGGPGPFADAALAAGEAVVLDGVDLGLVPVIVADGVMRWTVYDLPSGPPPEMVPLSEADHGLAGAMRTAATTLIELDVARHRPGVREEIEAIISGTPKLLWPEGMPPKPLRVLQRSIEVSAILQIASGDSPGGALSASAATARAQALWPLFDAVRVARRAAVDEAVRVFADRASRR